VIGTLVVNWCTVRFRILNIWYSED